MSHQTRRSVKINVLCDLVLSGYLISISTFIAAENRFDSRHWPLVVHAIHFFPLLISYQLLNWVFPNLEVLPSFSGNGTSSPSLIGQLSLQAFPIQLTTIYTLRIIGVFDLLAACVHIATYFSLTSILFDHHPATPNHLAAEQQPRTFILFSFLALAFSFNSFVYASHLSSMRKSYSSP